MLKSFSKQLAKKLQCNDIVSKQEIEIIAFGIEITSLKAIHFIVSILIGIIFGQTWNVLVFLLFYASLRTYTGGYHAKNNIICFFNSCVITILASLFWMLLPKESYAFITAAFLVISVPVILILSPVEDKNKPLDEAEQRHYRKKSLIITAIEAAIIVVSIIFAFCKIALVGSTALFILALLLIIGKAKNTLIEAKQ